MRKEDVFDTLRTIIKQYGYEEFIKVSTRKFESADFCVIDDDYLGFDAERTVRFRFIDRVYYLDCEDGLLGRYRDAQCQIVFMLRGDFDLVYEFGDQGSFYWVIERSKSGHCIDGDDYTDFINFFNEYDAEHNVQNTLCTRLHQLPYFETNEKNLALRTAAVWKKEAVTYIETHPDGKDRDEVIFALLCAALYARITKNDHERKNLTCNDYDEYMEILPVEGIVPLLKTKSKAIDFFKYIRDNDNEAVGFDDVATSEAELLILELLQKLTENNS